MKKKYLYIGCMSLIMACGEKKTAEHKPATLPKPGTVVASADMPAGDELNHFTFSVKVVADSAIADGVYDVDADYGPNFSEGTVTMPKGATNATPAIRKGSDPKTFIVGFRTADDTTFHDYFEVSSDGKQTKMRYIKAYSF